MIPLSQSPYARVGNVQFLFLLFLGLFTVRPMTQAWGFWGLFPILVVVFGVIYYVTRNDSRPRVLQDMQRLKKSLPWFTPQPVTCHALPPTAEFATVLKRHGFDALELDGNRVRTWHDLTAALQELVGPMRWPEDPRHKVRTLLAKLAAQKPRRRVLIWRDAHRSAADNPALVGTFVADWSAEALVQPAGLLVFLDLPDAAGRVDRGSGSGSGGGGGGGAEVPASAPAAATAAEPDVRALADAPEGAWWKPVPGELTR